MVEEELMGKRFLFIFLILSVLNLAARSQEVTGSLEGNIVDPQGMSLEDVDVIVEGEQLIGIRAVKSDSQGYFLVSALPSGSYQIKLFFFLAMHRRLDIHRMNLYIYR